MIKSETITSKFGPISCYRTLNLSHRLTFSTFANQFAIHYRVSVSLISQSKSRLSMATSFMYYPEVPNIAYETDKTVNSVFGVNLGKFYDSVYVLNSADNPNFSFGNLTYDIDLSSSEERSSSSINELENSFQDTWKRALDVLFSFFVCFLFLLS